MSRWNIRRAPRLFGPADVSARAKGLTMPILGYLLYVGGMLLALLFVADIYVPKHAPRDEVPHTYNIPITAAVTASAPIVFSGQTQDFGRPPPMTIVDLASHSRQPAEAPTQPAQATNQAQATVAARSEARPVRKKIARRKVAPENSYAQIPDEWRSRYTNTGMAFARPFGW
jgi:hypothetical protein